MRKFAFKLFLAMLATLVAGGLLYAARSGSGQTHLQNEECGNCHLAGRNVGIAQAGMLVGSQETLCGKCHPAAIRVSHPSGFTPVNKPADSYPLDWKGDLTCSTCHDVHGNSPSLMRGTKSGKEFCFACHDAGFFRKMRDGGASLMVGHLARGVEAGAPLLDVYSRQCMECHGSNADPRLVTSIDRNGIARHAGSRVNHPVGISYQKATAFGGYLPRRVVEKKLLLPDGLVSCVSCHQGYRKDHGKLVVSSAQSRLCYECHDL
jgi:predicted CXXCH cytochrome family protein